MKKILAVLTGLALLIGSVVPACGLIGYVNRQTLVLYDEVRPGDEVEIRALFDGQEKEYHITINSKGGHAFVGLSIVNHIADLKESGSHITTEVSGSAMSAAAIIWLMGDVRIVHKYDVVMFHEVRMMDQFGNRIPDETLGPNQKLVMDTINKAAISRLTAILGDEDQARTIVENETYLTGAQAYAMGLATTLK